MRAICEIYSVARKNAYRWKWRYVNAHGARIDCAEEYAQFLECVRAARARGYEPRASWMRSTLLAEKGAAASGASVPPPRGIDSIINELLGSFPTMRSIWLVGDCANSPVHAARLFTWDLIAYADPLGVRRLRRAHKLRRHDVRLRVMGAGNRLHSTGGRDEGRAADAFASEWEECNPGDGYYFECSGAGQAAKRTRRRAICVWHGIHPLRAPGS